ncbi:hypothetical protein IJ135_02045 [Candidatus Saccharibacteria bacterium]|nr:hypothetical protein [Candidatus Saccharibacteria bacterium]
MKKYVPRLTICDLDEFYADDGSLDAPLWLGDEDAIETMFSDEAEDSDAADALRSDSIWAVLNADVDDDDEEDDDFGPSDIWLSDDEPDEGDEEDEDDEDTEDIDAQDFAGIFDVNPEADDARYGYGFVGIVEDDALDSVSE